MLKGKFSYIYIYIKLKLVHDVINQKPCKRSLYDHLWQQLWCGRILIKSVLWFVWRRTGPPLIYFMSQSAPTNLICKLQETLYSERCGLCWYLFLFENATLFVRQVEIIMLPQTLKIKIKPTEVFVSHKKCMVHSITQLLLLTYCYIT